MAVHYHTSPDHWRINKMLLSGKNAAVEYTVMSTPMEGVEPEEKCDPGATRT